MAKKTDLPDNEAALVELVQTLERTRGACVALCEAVRWSLYAEIERLLKEGVDPNCRVQNEMTPLMHATRLRAAELLVLNGASLNARDANGRTALIWFLLGSHRRASAELFVSFLVRSGADWSYVSTLGEDPVELARQKYGPGFVEKCGGNSARD